MLWRLQLVNQLNRFLALQALVERLGICIATIGLKFPILLNCLLPTGNSSPAPRFYGLPKIHKANCPMHSIVSACGTATYQLAKFLTKILQRYTGITPSFVKDSKSFSDHLRMVKISGEEELVSFDVSALFTSIPVPTALDIINRLFTEHIEDPEAKNKY